jgi:hypothetical protein
MALGWISGGRVALEFSAKRLKFPVIFPVSGNLAENGSLWTGSSASHISATAGFLTPAVGTGSAHGLELHPGKTNATRTHAAEASSPRPVGLRCAF